VRGGCVAQESAGASSSLSAELVVNSPVHRFGPDRA
jgi:hypothetical protein